MEFAGKIIHVTPLETIGEKQKRNLIIEEVKEGDYKNSVVVEFYWDKVALTTGYAEWDVVTVSINPRVREYNWKWYQTLSWWKITWNKSNPDAVAAPAPSTAVADFSF